MNKPTDAAGKGSGTSRPAEQEAVLTTIVGSRPPGSGQPVGQVPRGIEVLVKKAAIDPDFKNLLLEQRAGAAGEIGLELDPAEALMLGAVPLEQLEGIIAQTSVPEEHRRAFLGKVAAGMLAALGVTASGCPPVVKGIRPEPPAPTGIAPDRPDPKKKPEKPSPKEELLRGTGIAPDRPDPKKKPEKPSPQEEPVKGIRPDKPEEKKPPQG